MRSRLFSGLLAAMLIAASAFPASAAQGWLGVSTQPTDADLRKGLDLTRDGLLVNRVFEDSPAERAGLQKGDVILRFDGKSVTEPVELRDAVRDAGSGRTAKLEIWRNSAARTLDVKLAELPASEQYSFETPVPAPTAPLAPKPPSASSPDRSRAPELDRLHTPEAPPAPDAHGDQHVRRKVFVNGRELTDEEIDEKLKDLGIKDMTDWNELKELKGLKDLDRMHTWRFDDGNLMFGRGDRGRLGVRVEKLSPELGEALGVPSGKGVVVLEVIEDTPAQKAGLRAGDVILEVAGHEVTDRDDLSRTLRDREGRVDIVLTRKGARRTVQADLPARGRVRSFSYGPDSRTFTMRIPELRHAPRVYRYPRDHDGGEEALREEMNQLRQEMRELKEQLGAKEQVQEKPKEPAKPKAATPAPAPKKK